MSVSIVRPVVIVSALIAANAFWNSNAQSQNVNACVHKNTGAIRIVAANTTCKKSESPLQWGVTGLQGPQGVPGAVGSPGATGPMGLQGVPGAAGSPGSTGPMGLQGAAGIGAAIVVDSTGKEIGAYSDATGQPAASDANALVSINGIWFQLPVSTGGFAGGGVALEYASSDCSGPAYIGAAPVYIGAGDNLYDNLVVEAQLKNTNPTPTVTATPTVAPSATPGFTTPTPTYTAPIPTPTPSGPFTILHGAGVAADSLYYLAPSSRNFCNNLSFAFNSELDLTGNGSGGGCRAIMPSNPCGTFVCDTKGATCLWWGTPTVFDLSTLNFIPPFSIQMAPN